MPPHNKLEVVGLKWDEFLTYFRSRWEPGQHMCIVAPTGGGKTTAMVGILPMRRYVVALDPKGGDDTLGALRKAGFVDSEWPPGKEIRKDIEEGRPARLLVGANVGSIKDLPKLRRTVAQVLRDAFEERGWTVYIDELQIVADRNLMRLGPSVERNMIAARTRKVSMVMAFQRPANVPRNAHEMSTWFMVMYTRDRDTVDRLAEMAGRHTSEIRGMVQGLEEFSFLMFSRNPRDPVIVTRADKA